MRTASTEKSLEKALHHVSDGWMPPQAEVLEAVQRRLDAGEYDEDRSQLTQDLKKDFPLFVYCLKELAQILSDGENAGSQSFGLTPREIFENTSPEALRKVLNSSTKTISKHSLSDTNKYQVTRLQETILSATTAEALSESAEIDPELGFSCGLLRQLGLTLIAWNYPRLYARAVQTLTPKMHLDESLKRMLGFSPSLLGISFARRWNLSGDIIRAMGGRAKPAASINFSTDERRVSSASHVGATLAKICEVGEALARANNPEHYPSALHDWEHAEEAIASYLGPDGMQQIYSRAQDHLKIYAEQNPELLTFCQSSGTREKILDSHYSTTLYSSNPYVGRIPKELASEIKGFYGRFKRNRILKTNVDYFIREILPKAGFHCGCIFTYDPQKRHLFPALRIGELPPQRARPLRVGSVVAQFDIIASAYSLKAPLREERRTKEDENVFVIASSLGQITPVGVLYLEIREDAVPSESGEVMLLFKAIHQTLLDCLNLD